jgi:hypothetical protein
MPTPPPGPEVSPEGHTYAVAAPAMVGSLCPECWKWPVRPGQVVCSPRCRAARWRHRQVESQALRTQEVLALLEHAERLEARAAELRGQARKRLAERTE